MPFIKRNTFNGFSFPNFINKDIMTFYKYLTKFSNIIISVKIFLILYFYFLDNISNLLVFQIVFIIMSFQIKTYTTLISVSGILYTDACHEIRTFVVLLSYDIFTIYTLHIKKGGFF